MTLQMRCKGSNTQLDIWGIFTLLQEEEVTHYSVSAHLLFDFSELLNSICNQHITYDVKMGHIFKDF